MDDFLKENIRSGESQESGEKFPVFYANIHKDPLTGDNVITRVLQSMGYQISFQEAADRRIARDYHYTSMVDSLITKSKLDRICSSLANTDVFKIVTYASGMGFQFFYDLIKGNLDEPSCKEFNKSVRTLDLNDPRIKISLEKCYLRNVEFEKEQFKDDTDFFKI